MLLYELVHSDNTAQAYRLLQDLKEIEKFQTNPEFWYYYGVVAWVAGHPWDAAIFWDQAIELGYPQGSLSSPIHKTLDFIDSFAYSL